MHQSDIISAGLSWAISRTAPTELTSVSTWSKLPGSEEPLELTRRRQQIREPISMQFFSDGYYETAALGRYYDGKKYSTHDFYMGASLHIHVDWAGPAGPFVLGFSPVN